MSVTLVAKPQHSKALVREYLRQYQDTLTQALEKLDGKAHFIEDAWTRDSLGHGRTRVIAAGDYFEQGGVNFSEINGTKVPASLLGQHPTLEGHSFWGAGVSLVLHPLNPHCPTVHLNYRYFEAGPVWWFGGGADLTPYYPYQEDCVHWHQCYKQTMDKHDPNYYPAFKYWCDEYFYNHHRGETRGIGGTFYDYLDGRAGQLVKRDVARQSEQGQHAALSLTQSAKKWDALFQFQQDNAATFLRAYLPIAAQRRTLTWTEQQRQFQLYRRGRYVEFNLLHDRGTLFGLQSKGRVESILMSLPPLVRWQYNYMPEAGSAEATLTETYLHRGIDWTRDHKPIKKQKDDEKERS